jgi:hypothetical protein
VGDARFPSISVVLRTYRPERDALLELLATLSADDWTQPTECPTYSMKGIATHVLGDDFSLLSRQQDGAVQGLVYMADELPGADFRTLLDAFNDRWVATTRFMSPLLLIELLRLTGEWTAAYYACRPALNGTRYLRPATMRAAGWGAGWLSG